MPTWNPGALTPRRFSFAEILAPVTVEDFLAAYWETQHLHIRRCDPTLYAGIFSFAEIDRYLAVAAQHSGERLSLTRDGKGDDTVPLKSVKPGDLYRAVHDGWSVKLAEIDRCWPPAAELASAFGVALSARVHINAYLTPAGYQGAPIHADTHEVFALQIGGHKRWSIYRDWFHQPLETLTHTFQLYRQPARQGDDAPLAEEVVLEEGDLLYIPRGVVHRAVAPKDSPSLHLCAAVSPFYWVDLLKAALEDLSARRRELSRALTPGFERDSAIRLRMRETFEEAVRLFADEASYESGLGLLRRALEGIRSDPADGHFEQLLRLEEIGPDTWIERRRGMGCSLQTDGESISLHFRTGGLKGPVSLVAALEFIHDHLRFQVCDLPGSMSDRSKLVLVRRLIREGLLRAELPAESPIGGELQAVSAGAEE